MSQVQQVPDTWRGTNQGQHPWFNQPRQPVGRTFPKTALIAVDVQEDFLPNGALGVPEGHQVVPVIQDHMHRAEVLVFTADWHPEDHKSFSDEPTYSDCSWPRHCVQDTQGAEFDYDLIKFARDTGLPMLFVYKGVDPKLEALSGFDGRVVKGENLYRDYKGAHLADALNDLGVTKNLVTGLALDYCVRATAVDSVGEGFDTTVIVGATRPVSLETGIKAVIEMLDNGVHFE